MPGDRGGARRAGGAAGSPARRPPVRCRRAAAEVELVGDDAGRRRGRRARRSRSESSRSTTVTVAPRSSRTSAQRLRRPGPRRRARGRRSSSGHPVDPQEVGVEEAEAEATPMPAMIQNRTTMVTSLQPAELEVVLERRHPEDPFAGELERVIWIITLAVMMTKSAPRIGRSRIVLEAKASPAMSAAEAERTGVAHEDPGRRGVPPQEPEHGPGGGRRRSARSPAGRAPRSSRLSAGWALAAPVPVLPEADDHVRAEHHHRGAGGEAVEAVGEVHAVGVALTRRTNSTTVPILVMLSRRCRWMKERNGVATVSDLVDRWTGVVDGQEAEDRGGDE